MADFLFFHLALFLPVQLPLIAARRTLPQPPLPASAPSAQPSQPPGVPLAPYGPEDVYRGYVSLVQAYLRFFLPASSTTAAVSAQAAPLPLQELHGVRLVHILAEVWMADAALRSAADDDGEDDGRLWGSDAQSAAATSPFAPFALPPFASTSGSSVRMHRPLSSAYPGYSYRELPVPAPFAPPSLHLTGCVRALVGHVQSVERLPGTREGGPLGESPWSAHPQPRSRARTAGAAAPSALGPALSVPSPLPLCRCGVDVLVYRFLLAAFRNPPGLYDERLQAAVQLWLGVLALGPAAASSDAGGPSAFVCGLFAFCSPLLLCFLRALLELDIGREGSAARAQCLTQALQLVRTLEAVRPQLAEVERRVLEPVVVEDRGARARHGAGGGGGGGGGGGAPRLPAAAYSEPDVLRAQLLRLTRCPPERLIAVWIVAPSGPTLPPAAQLMADVLRLTAPSTVRHALRDARSPASSASASAIVPPPASSSHMSLSRASSASFRSLLVHEDALWRELREAAMRLLQLPEDDEGECGAANARAPPGADATRPAAYSDAVRPRSLSPERLAADAFHRLSSTGRSQLKAGVALCTRRLAVFVGSEWERPATADESARAVRALGAAHRALLSAAQRADRRGLSAALLDALSRAPLRALARWDVLIAVAVTATSSAALLLLAAIHA